MKTTLPTLSDFIDKLKDRETDVLNIIIYNDFLKQPLKLEMFIPCNDKGEPMLMPGSAPIYTHSKEYETDWRKAQSRVIFKGFELLVQNSIAIYLKGTLMNIRFNIDGNVMTDTRYIKSISDLCEKVELTDKEYERLNLR